MELRRNWSYVIPDGEHKGKEIWSGRYAVAVAIVFCHFIDGWKVLANRRGIGCPSHIGEWNMPAGFMEWESGEEAASRECFEETGIRINPNKFLFMDVETRPKKAGNTIALRYLAILDSVKDDIHRAIPEGGELNEVSEVQWIDLNKIEDYTWAFNHLEVIKTFIPSLYTYIQNA